VDCTCLGIGQEVGGHAQHERLGIVHHAPDAAAYRRAEFSECIDVASESPKQYRFAQRAEEHRQRDIGHVFGLMSDHKRIETAASDPCEDWLVDERASENAPEAVLHLDMFECERWSGRGDADAGLRLAVEDEILPLPDDGQSLIERSAIGRHATLMQDGYSRMGHRPMQHGIVPETNRN